VVALQQELLLVPQLRLKLFLEEIDFKLRLIDELHLLRFHFKQLLLLRIELLFVLGLQQFDLVCSFLESVLQRSQFSLQPLAVGVEFLF